MGGFWGVTAIGCGGPGIAGLAMKRRSPMVTGAQSPGTVQLAGHGRAVGPNRTDDR